MFVFAICNDSCCFLIYITNWLPMTWKCCCTVESIIYENQQCRQQQNVHCSCGKIDFHDWGATCRVSIGKPDETEATYFIVLRLMDLRRGISRVERCTRHQWRHPVRSFSRHLDAAILTTHTINTVQVGIYLKVGKNGREWMSVDTEWQTTTPTFCLCTTWLCSHWCVHVLSSVLQCPHFFFYLHRFF